MYRNPLDLFRLFLSLFQDLPPLSRTLYVPGAILLLGYPVLTVLLGQSDDGQAFVTAFMAALAVRIALGFEGMVRRMLTKYSAAQAALLAIGFAAVPLLVLSFAADPVWCQRMQSAFYLVIGAIFLSDAVKKPGRDGGKLLARCRNAPAPAEPDPGDGGLQLRLPAFERNPDPHGCRVELAFVLGGLADPGPYRPARAGADGGQSGRGSPRLIGRKSCSHG